MRSKSWMICLRAIPLLLRSCYKNGRAGLRPASLTLHASSCGAATLTLNAASFFLVGGLVSPVQAQLPSWQDLNLPSPNLLNQDQSDRVDSACIRLDERCLFKIADRKSDLPNRVQGIEQRLNDISRIYFNNETAKLDIYQKQEQNLPNIYVSVGGKTFRLLSVTSQDANREGVELETRADQIIDQLKQGLEQAKQARQPEALARQIQIPLNPPF